MQVEVITVIMQTELLVILQFLDGHWNKIPNK